MKKHLPTSLIDHDHAYTRSTSPWIITECKSAYDRMISYISGGGMSTFGRTVRQEEVRRRRLRFLIASAVLAGLWLLFWIF